MAINWTTEYENQPKATTNMDGTLVVYTSDWTDETETDEIAEVYIMWLPPPEDAEDAETVKSYSGVSFN